ncbi:DUF551 domain-containing protein [Pseudomonas nitroreducens]|uniref:DUF551 domain-containing protein n=1 Tax=Pseudomonas nitroreducens TaxID=46680 RepID=UPI003CC81E81
MPANNHPEDQTAIEAMHGRMTDHINDQLLAFQDEAYSLGHARGEALATHLLNWIPVSARLPSEEQGTVAVLFDDGQPGVAWASYWHGAQTGFACWTFPLDELGEGRTVTHWFALPGAPA